MYDKCICGLLLNKILEEGIRHVIHCLLVDINMECLKLAFLSLCRNIITTGFYLLKTSKLFIGVYSNFFQHSMTSSVNVNTRNLVIETLFRAVIIRLQPSDFAAIFNHKVLI